MNSSSDGRTANAVKHTNVFLSTICMLLLLLFAKGLAGEPSKKLDDAERDEILKIRQLVWDSYFLLSNASSTRNELALRSISSIRKASSSSGRRTAQKNHHRISLTELQPARAHELGDANRILPVVRDRLAAVNLHLQLVTFGNAEPSERKRSLALLGESRQDTLHRAQCIL
jgi:hypothetical protein